MAASSSSSVVPTRRKGGWTYDVFLSFRGEDTRNNFVDHLFAALVQKGINTFKDDEMLGGGQPIKEELLKAIKESRWAVVVFSKNYANSSWCLEEISYIMECHKQMMGQKKVLPVFYHVDPSDIRKQKGDFATAFETHEDKFKGGEMDKVNKWRDALSAAANLSGQHILPDYGGEASFINKIVQQISSDIQPRAFGMREKIKALNFAAIDMKRRKEHNDVKNLMVPDRVPSWLEEAHQVIIDNEGDSISAGGNGYLHIKKRYITGEHCSNVIEHIDRLMEEKSNMEWTNEQIPLGMVSSATPQVPQDVTQNIFGSRKEIFQRALQLLEADNTTQMVALCGMGGIGKTTMMKELKKDVENRKLFDWVVSVVIGNSTDPIAFQEAIAQYTSGNLSESTREARADRLEKRFLGMSQDGKKKILIILDDLWNIVDLKDIGLASPLPKGFKLFLTSRYEMLCRQMGVETSSIFRMVGLEEAEAKQLFWETTGLSDGAGDQELHKLGEDIVMRCGGLPMAIKTIALALTGEIKDAWRVTLLHLRRHDLQDLQGHYDVVHDIFEISYNYLKKVDDKEIFILSGLFPDDFDIPLEDLMRYGWGLKLFDRVYSLAEARQRTNTSVHNLIRANLLVESDRKGCVKMHDLARSFVLYNISKFKQASIVNHSDMSEWRTQDTRESCERILLKCKGMFEFPEHFDYPDLKLLKLMMYDNEKEPLKFPDDFHARMKKLQVISYRSIRYLWLPPISLECSTSLRVLCLRSCFLMDDLSSIGQLSNLEILSFAYCSIKNLPSAVGKLRKLKLLDLTGCYELCIGDGVFQNLDNLEELYMGNLGSFTEDNYEGLEMVSKKLTALEAEFDENNIRPDNVSFKNLERFTICIGCELDIVYSFEKTLELVASCEKVRASGINELFEKTEQLYLQVEDMNHLEDVLMHPSDQYSFCNLKFLHIEECANLKYLFTDNVASTLTNLETLIVYSCPVLGSLIHDENNGAEVIKFRKLKYLELNDLPRFEGLCDNINIVTELPQLVKLRLISLPNITCIFDSSNNISATTVPLLNKQVVCPKLEILDIQRMKNLKEILACEEEYDRTPVLKEIEVEKCDEIQNLFPRNPMRLLSHLETLVVDDCGSIQALFDIDSECVGQVNSSLSSIEARRLGKLREVWRIKGEDNSGLLIRDFQALKSIEIERCKNFRNLVTPTTIKFDMGALTDIIIDLSKESDQEIEISEVDDSRVAVLFSSVHTLHHVSSIKLLSFKQVEVIFDIQIPYVGIVTPNDDEQPLLLPCLTKMSLIHLKSMTHLWKCNWSKFLMLHNYQQKSSFQNLTTIYMKNCEIIEYLFSPLMATLLSNLKKVEIDNCERIQEVVSNRDDEDEESTISTSTSTTINLFPRLDFLTLGNLKNLKRIGGGIPKGTTDHAGNDNFTFFVPWSLGQYSRKITIKSCHALSTVIPSYAAEQLLKIEVLEIDDCNSMVDVFETKELENSHVFGQVSGGRDNTTITAIPRLKSITMHKLPNLKKLDIVKCHRLVDIFTFSTLGSLGLLEKLSIRDCLQLKVIVREEHGEQTTTTSKAVIFPCLNSIILADLPNLKGFFFGMNEFHLPLLNEVIINRCPQMTVLTSLPLISPKIKYTHINTLPQFSVLWSLCQYSRMIRITSCHALSTVIPSYVAEQPQKIEVLDIYDCNSMMEVFETKKLENSPVFGQVSGGRDDTTLAAIPRLKSITMHKMPNLKKLDIVKCHRLVYIFTFSTLGSLRLLEKLSIRYCKQLKVIVGEEHGEQTKTTSKAVIFPCLKSIILADLPNLKGFFFGMNKFQLPLLDELSINRCPQMMVLTSLPLIAPTLKYIHINGGKYCIPECCSFFTKATLPETPSQSSANTNSWTTISEEFLSHFHSLIEMNLLFDRERQVIFSYDELLQLQNLEKLHAKDCHSVLEVFDIGTGVRCSNSSQTVVKLPKLSDVDLWALKSLKYIWKSNGRTILEFPNLTKLSIWDCPQLEHVFTSSMVGSLLQLKELSIQSCQGMEVIVKEDQEEEGGRGDGKVNEIRLPCLKYLLLKNLESLKGFCLGNVDYSLPSLDSMRILNCKSLTIFTKGRSCVPKLKFIETSFGYIKLAEEQDVNSLIITKRQEGFHFGNQD